MVIKKSGDVTYTNPLKRTDSVDKAVTDYSKKDTRDIVSGQVKCTPESQ